MAKRHSFRLRPHLFVLVHGGSGSPYALRLHVEKLTGALAFIAAAFTLCGLGSLLFFRELELNRKLEERLLEIQTRQRLGEVPIPLSAPRAVAASAPIVPSPVTEATPTTGSEPAAPTTTGTEINARIADLVADCATENCEVRLSMVPTRAGMANGQLLVVLETEIPRIGAGNPTTQVRKRYFAYPGIQTRDDLDQNTLLALDRKPFRFSRALQTTASFQIGKLLRPLAVNVYLFGPDHSLVHHERKAIESDE